MEFNQLEAFVNVAKYRSFSRAADALYLSQPTISSQIKSLEVELGVTIFDRNSKEIILTEAGILFYGYARDLLNLREKALLSLQEDRGNLCGVLEIATSTVPGQYLLPEAVAVFRKVYPEVRYHLNQQSSREVLEQILSSHVSVGVVGVKVSNEKLIYRELVDDELMFIAPTTGGYPKEVQNVKELGNYDFILRDTGSGTRMVFEQALAGSEIDFGDIPIRAYVQSTEAVIQAVKNGLGISVVSRRAVTDYLRFGIVQALGVPNLDLRRKFHLVYHNKRILPLVAETFISFIVDYFNKG